MVQVVNVVNGDALGVVTNKTQIKVFFSSIRPPRYKKNITIHASFYSYKYIDLHFLQYFIAYKEVYFLTEVLLSLVFTFEYSWKNV